MKYTKMVMVGSLLVMSFLGALSAMEDDEKREPVWVYLSDTKEKTDIKHDEWRINNKKLEVNINADDPISFENLDESLHAAKNGHYALLLIALRDQANFYHILAPLLNGGKKASILHDLAAKWIDPITNEPIIDAEIYFAGPDRKFYLLADNAKQSFFQTKLTQNIGEENVGDRQQRKMQGIYEVIEQLQPTAALGESYYYVANLFNQEADKPIIEDQQEKQERLNQKQTLQQKLQESETEMQKLNEEAQNAEGDRIEHIFSRIPKLEEEITLLKLQVEQLDKPVQSTKSQLLKQYARRWYGWVPEDSQKYALAQEEMKKIPNKPQLFPVELQDKVMQKPIEINVPKPIEIKHPKPKEVKVPKPKVPKPVTIEHQKPRRIEHPKPIEIKNPYQKPIDVSLDESDILQRCLQNLARALNQLTLRIR